MPKKCPCVSRELKATSTFLKAIADDTRLRIICLLKQKELCVCEIMEALKLPHNLLLHHFKPLLKIGLLNKRAKGRFTYYRLEKKSFNTLRKQINNLLN